MVHPLGEPGEEAVVARVGNAMAHAATEGRLAGEDAHQTVRRVAIDFAGGMLAAGRPEIASHSDDVQVVAGAIARWLGQAGQRFDDVLVAARLHDIGKLAIPAAILDKQGPLEPIEWVSIRRHTIAGEQILVSVPELRGAARLVRHSHERWDGLGYPDGLAGEEIPIGSRIIFCADAFSAIRADRSYRPGSSTAEALAEITACSGTQFDPDVVQALQELAGGLLIAGNRVRAHSRRTTRLFAVLLIVSIGAGGSAVARSGVIPDPETQRALPGPESSSTTSSGLPAGPTRPATDRFAQSTGVPVFAGPGGASTSPLRVSLPDGAGAADYHQAAPPAGTDHSSGGEWVPGHESQTSGQAKDGEKGTTGHGNGAGLTKPKSFPKKGGKSKPESAGPRGGASSNGNPANANVASAGHGASKVRRRNPAQPRNPSHDTPNPGGSTNAGLKTGIANGNGNGHH